MSPDADPAGDLESCKRTSDLWLELRSVDDRRCWPLAWRSKWQGSTASSTCEAEMISLATALKAEVLPIMELLEQALCRPVWLRCLEKNTQSFQAAETRVTAPTPDGADLGWRANSFYKELHESVYHESFSLKGDMFTKRLEPNAFERALTLGRIEVYGRFP